MPRLRHTIGALLVSTTLLVAGQGVLAQDSGSPDIGARARMAAITLDGATLPGGYVFTGETFLGANQVASGDLPADELTQAGFESQYVSAYRNPDNGLVIRSYVSAWTDAAAAETGFGLLEDEARTQPGGSFEDADAPVGEGPGEITTGTYPDPQDEGTTVSMVDVTFRVDRFLVGATLETRDGSEPDAEIVTTLAGTLESRATSALADESPEGTDLQLPPRALPLAGLGQELQAGFLDGGDVEQMYGLQGSALGGLSASWSQAIGLGEGDALQPFVSVGLTTFGSADDANAVIDQIDDLAPDVAGSAPVDGVAVEGAGSVAAFSYPSPATGAAEPDSFRVVAVAESALVVVDVQGAPDLAAAQTTATQLATAQVSCLGQPECPAPTLPAELTGQ
jgi:hypothetical protein